MGDQLPAGGPDSERLWSEWTRRAQDGDGSTHVAARAGPPARDHRASRAERRGLAAVQAEQRAHSHVAADLQCIACGPGRSWGATARAAGELARAQYRQL